MKHAYLIIAHSNWDQLKLLVSMLDGKDNDIYIHIDAKANGCPKEEIVNSAKLSDVKIFSKYRVYWGSYEIVATELLLFKEASKEHHDYYHLLSGADLPIKSQKEINDFFEKNAGYEFVHFDTDERLKKDHEIGRRTRLYHFFQNYRRRYKVELFNQVFTFLERVLLVIQLALRVDRMKRHPKLQIRYGSQWVSITEKLVKYIISKEILISDVFSKTNCADELFIQTIVYNSAFRNHLYDKNYDDDIHANMRLIDMKKRGSNGNPYTWRLDDYNEIINSDCLFARKFNDQIDSRIIKRIEKYVSEAAV